MNRRPNPNQYPIRSVQTGGRALFYKRRKLSDSPNAIRQRKCRDRLRKMIDCRICSRCRYAFISRSGMNNCSVCYEDAHQAYRTYTFRDPDRLLQVSVYRAWAKETGFFPWGEESMHPKYPIPNLDKIKVEIGKTFDKMRHGDYRDRCMWMPRVLGLKPYLDVQQMPDLRKCRAKAA